MGSELDITWAVFFLCGIQLYYGSVRPMWLQVLY